MKYADDTVLFVSYKDITIIEKLINDDFHVFCSWLEPNELIINLKKGKTEFMVFGTNKRLNKLRDPPMEIECRGTEYCQLYNVRPINTLVYSSTVH